jgi:hypothetical protein
MEHPRIDIHVPLLGTRRDDAYSGGRTRLLSIWDGTYRGVFMEGLAAIAMVRLIERSAFVCGIITKLYTKCQNHLITYW